MALLGIAFRLTLTPSGGHSGAALACVANIARRVKPPRPSFGMLKPTGAPQKRAWLAVVRVYRDGKIRRIIAGRIAWAIACGSWPRGSGAAAQWRRQ